MILMFNLQKTSTGVGLGGTGCGVRRLAGRGRHGEMEMGQLLCSPFGCPTVVTDRCGLECESVETASRAWGAAPSLPPSRERTLSRHLGTGFGSAPLQVCGLGWLRCGVGALWAAEEVVSSW